MRVRKSAVVCFLIGISILAPSGAALPQVGGLDPNKPPEFLKKITDGGDFARPKLGKGYRAGLYPTQRSDLTGIHISINPDYLGDRSPEFRDEGNAVSINYVANEKDIIAAFGLLFRVTSVQKNQRHGGTAYYS